jgi:predicted transcriptional regulator
MTKANKFYIAERFAKGFANHRRVEILFLIEQKTEQSVGDIANTLKINFVTVSDHIRKLAQSGIVMKRHEGNNVRHALTEKGKITVRFLKDVLSK